MYDDIKINKKIQDPNFYKEFSKEWKEITEKLQKRYNEYKLKQKFIKENELDRLYRPTSSSVVFK